MDVRLRADLAVPESLLYEYGVYADLGIVDAPGMSSGAGAARSWVACRGGLRSGPMNPYVITLWVVGLLAAAVTGLLAIAAGEAYDSDAAQLVGWIGVTGPVALLCLVAACAVSALRWQPVEDTEPTTVEGGPAPHLDGDAR
jgi:hypothetical protein